MVVVRFRIVFRVNITQNVKRKNLTISHRIGQLNNRHTCVTFSINIKYA